MPSEPAPERPSIQDSVSQRGSISRRDRSSIISTRSLSTKTSVVTSKLTDLRDNRAKALEKVQLRVLYVIMMLVVVIPILIQFLLPFGTSLCVSLGILLFTLIADLDLDRFLARRPKVSRAS